MSKRRFRVRFAGEAIIELDDAIISAVDDEWRTKFYDLGTPHDIAEHISYNLILRRTRLSKLDGWADMEDNLACVVREPEWVTFATEED